MDETQDVQQPQSAAPESAPAPQTAASQPAPMATGDGYGKKSSWSKMLLIYVVIAIVVYGVIWYFWIR